MQQPIIAPSVLAADFANLQRDIEMLNRSEADWIHIDNRRRATSRSVGSGGVDGILDSTMHDHVEKNPKAVFFSASTRR